LHIKTVFKNEQGAFDFEGELTPQEHALVVNVGLTTLFENGALPFSMMEKEDMARFNGTYEGGSN
jgi:hypothetical protein